MILKYYAEVPSLIEAVKYYGEIFEADVMKNGTNGHHASLKLFGQISLLLHNSPQKRSSPVIM